MIAARRDFFDLWIVADYDYARAEALVERIDDPRFIARQVDAGNPDEVAGMAISNEVTHILNLVDPRFVMSVFNGARFAGCDYLDTAMSLSQKHPDRPYELTGVKLGDEQFAQSDTWAEYDRLALVGIGVEPGLADVSRAYASDHLFSEIDELGCATPPTWSCRATISRHRSRSGR